jgi:hypothetical protein
MVDFTSTQARAKEVAPLASHEGVQIEAAAAKPLSASPPLTDDGVDKMYRQLVEICAIATARLAPQPLLTSHPGPHCGGRVGMSSHKPAVRLASIVEAHNSSALH